MKENDSESQAEGHEQNNHCIVVKCCNLVSTDCYHSTKFFLNNVGIIL